MSGWWQTGRGRLTTAILLILLLGQVWYTVDSRIPFLRSTAAWWTDPLDFVVAQRRAYGGDLFDYLAFSRAYLPPGADVLLITAGQDPYGSEYIAYHRALYALYPHRVWWVTPLPVTRRPTWWRTSDLSADSLRAIASQVGAPYVLLYNVDRPLPIGHKVAEFRPQASLWFLGIP